MFIFHNYTIMILQSQIPLYSKKHWFIIYRSCKSQLGDFRQFPWHCLACKLQCAYCVFTSKAGVQSHDSPQMSVARFALLLELAVCVVTV